MVCANPVNPVYIGDVPVGDGYPTVFMAEIATFFNQDIGLAIDYIDRAIEAGTPVVKTEILHDTNICLKNSGLLHRYIHGTGTKEEDYYSLIERKVVSFEKYEQIFAHCRKRNIPYVASVYDLEGIDFFVRVGGAAIKIARNNINNIPLIRHAAKTNLPVFFDAGEVYIDELAAAIRLAQAEGDGGVIINHHPGRNPAAAEIHNLRLIKKYKEFFNLPVGLACHYRGDEILYAAVGQGANILEKGIDADPDRIEQDVISAAPLDRLEEIIQKVNNCWKSLGDGNWDLPKKRDLSVRTCLVAKKFVPAGNELTTDNVRFSWPPIGISVEYWGLVEGKTAACDIQEGAVLQWDEIDLSH